MHIKIYDFILRGTPQLFFCYNINNLNSIEKKNISSIISAFLITIYFSIKKYFFFLGS
jgi:hypothetical protein